jgi:hypothetical protein
MSLLLTLAALWAPARSASAVTSLAVTTARPRILGNGADLAAFRSLATCDAVGRDLSERLKHKANGFISQPVVAYDATRPQDLYGVSQIVLDRSATLSMAWQLTGDATYADRLWSELDSAARYPHWNATGNFLATSSLAEALAVGYDAAFDRWSPAQKQVLRQAMVDKGLKPAILLYEQNVAWESQRGNYNVVSNTGVIMAALAVTDTDVTVAQSALQHAVSSLDNGISGFNPDGGYREGPQYWGYATQALVTTARALRASTGSDQGIFANSGVAATGDTAYSLTGPSNESFSYGDSKGVSINTKPQPTENPALLALGAEYKKAHLIKAGVDAAQAAGFNQWSMLWYRCGQQTSTASQAGLPLDSYHRDSQVTTMRSAWDQPRASYLGFKGATVAANSHPQLDGGSFVLDALGVNWATELGPDEYSLPGYQNSDPKSQRWSYYRQRAEGNNTLVLDPNLGPDQDTTLDSTITAVANSPTTSLAVADLTPSVRLVANSWRRGVQLFDNRKQMLVQDEVTGKKALDLWWGMHTDATISIAADGRSAVLTKQGQQMLARIASPAAATFTQRSARALWTGLDPAGQADSSGVRKLSIHLGETTQSTVAVQFTPLRPGVSTPAAVAVEPLSSWSAPDTPTAALTSLAVNGASVSGFQPGTLTYDATIKMPAGVPTVTATAATGTQVSVTQPASLPGVATITATASGLTPATYTVFVGKGQLKITYARASSGSAAATFDGNEVTKWVAAGNQTLQYNFAAVEKVSRVRVKWSPASASTSKFGIILSDDGSSWRTAASGSVPGTGGWATVNFPSATTRYVGVRIDSQGITTRYVGINELEIHNDADVVAAKPALPQPATVAMGSFSTDLRVQDSVALNHTVTDAAGSVVAPTTYASQWVTSDSAVVVVGPTGQLTAKGVGQAMVGVVVTSSLRTLAHRSVLVKVGDPWSSSIIASSDAYVSSVPAEINTNFGASKGLLVKKVTAYSTTNRESYVGFDLSAYRGKSIVSAKLVYSAVTSDSKGTAIDLDLHAVTGAWTESTVTYATKPQLGSRLGGSRVTSIQQSHTIDITSYVQQQVAASANASLGFYQDNPPNGAGLLTYLESRESTRKPTLLIQTAYVPR